MKKNLLLLVIVLMSTYVRAQNFAYGQFNIDELNMQKYDKDTSAHAVVLNEFGDARIALNGNHEFRLIFTYHIKIKIFDGKAIDKGTIEVRTYRGDADSFESLDSVKGVTYYIEDGNVSRAELDAKKVYTTKENKYYNITKFALPNVRNGSVIEYSYQLESSYFFNNLHTWEFQGDLPKINTEYQVHIPLYFKYKASLRGSRKFTKELFETEDNCTIINKESNPCQVITYGMSDVPAFITEDNMTSPKNFLSAVYFELEEFTDPYTFKKQQVTKRWTDIDDQLTTNEYFGSQLKKYALFKDKIKPVIADKRGDLEKAKAIYAYIQKWFKFNNYYGILSGDGIRKAIDTHTGSVADINMSLVVALNAAGIKAETVLLSTRDHGAINTTYPGITDFNYIVAKANVGDKSYLLDATDPLLPFSILPLKCLNDKGRVFGIDKPSYWIDLSSTTQREAETYNFNLTLREDGKITGTIIHYSAGYDSYLKRCEIKKFNTSAEYVENLDEHLPKLKILKSEILNLDSLNLPLTEKYEVEINAFDDLNHEQLSLDPYFLNKTTINPFTLAERDYPVDWGMPSDTRYMVSMHLPVQYKVETGPVDRAISLPNGGGSFTTNFTATANGFSFSNVITLGKSIYDPSEYRYLKDLYNKIIQAEKEDIIVKKKS